MDWVKEALNERRIMTLMALGAFYRSMLQTSPLIRLCVLVGFQAFVSLDVQRF